MLLAKYEQMNVQRFFFLIHRHLTRPKTYRDADKPLALPTSSCILFDGQNISFDASLVHSFIHSFSILSDDRSKASSKMIPPHSAIQSFLLQMRVYSPVLKVIQQFLTSSFSSSCHFHLFPFIFPSITCFRRQFLRKM